MLNSMPGSEMFPNVCVLKDSGLMPVRKKREYKKRKHKQAASVAQPTTMTVPPVRLQNYVDVGTVLRRGRQLSSDDELSVSTYVLSCCRLIILDLYDGMSFVSGGLFLSCLFILLFLCLLNTSLSLADSS